MLPREKFSIEMSMVLAGLFRLLGNTIIGMSSMVPAMAAESIVLADPAVPLPEAWRHQRFTGGTEYERTRLDGRAAIRAVGRDSASGLYREVSYRIADHPWLEWSWRVDQLQRTADIRVKDREDFAAAIFLMFGRPSMLNRDVLTLAYVWTSDRLAEGAMVRSPHHPDLLSDVVIRSGTGDLGRWVHERRNILHDFRKAFGREPPEVVEMVALFTDNDQTGEPVEAYYGTIKALDE